MLCLLGGSINKDINGKDRFVQCSNSGCKIIFFAPSVTEAANNNYLCPICRDRLTTHHLVQCSNCESIIDFIRIYDGEVPKVFYTLKCHNCIGSFEDETLLASYRYPNLLL